MSASELRPPALPPGGADLVVHTPGSLLVATDALLAHLPVLAGLADAVESDTHRIALLGLETPHGALRQAVEGCERSSAELADDIRRLRAGILAAELGYTAAERAATTLQDTLSDWVAGIAGRGLWAALPALALGGFAAWKLAPGSDRQKTALLQRWIIAHPELVTSPEFCTLVRRFVTGTDDAVLGALGVPEPLTLLLGEHGLGLLGVDTSAAAVIALGGMSGTRVMHETPVRVERVSERTGGAPPANATERLDRVPGDEQVRIERYSAPGQPDRYVVYVAPTQTFSPVADGEPWDLTSNIAGVAGLPAGSIRATEQAMADAGISSEAEVMLVGFSQGGLVADALAASGDWNTVALETYGDPGAGIELPEGIRGMAVHHTDDFVVATGGPQVPTDRLIVERQAYPDGSTMPTDRAVPAHQRDAYVETAERIDRSRSPQLRAELDAVDAFTHDYTAREGSEITTYSYRAERIPAPEVPAGLIDDLKDFDTRRFSASSSGVGG
ncbi:hypothetical protein [Protaetiibacter intestinalis]|uniref:Alpha/beta hydrolase n=1 Tax=Protaetiibacter intestinalis TaxID=2419774 RepID=A0A387B2L6_9MICO|nr:hypothetical protein [Protaetiibacter intestinalis]AYF97794.1 hypothetical protein D7I47_05670 [Protaetiibacter intestinalis]